jgi:enoyl-CoA hydratase/carnithine racemase
MSDSGVSYAVADGIARITFNRPPVNALTLDMIRAIIAALRRAAADDEARVVVLASAVERRFCAGLDLAMLLGKTGEQVRPFLQALYVDLNDAQYNLGKPSIAAVAGAARGGGMTLAISCDVIVAGVSASFGYPEIDIGVPPAIHFAHLPRIVGRHCAFELLFSGRRFDPQEALDLGLISKVVPDAALDATTAALAKDFAAKSPAAMRLGRAAFMRQNDYRRDIASAVEDFCNAVTTQAAQEGIRAFLERRAPNWRL